MGSGNQEALLPRSEYPVEKTPFTSTHDYDESFPVEDQPSRRQSFFRWITIALSICFFLLFFFHDQLPEACKHGKGKHGKGKHSIDKRVAKILKTTPLIDGHNDLGIFIRAAYNNHINNETFKHEFENGGLPMHVDLPRLKEGMNGGAFWSAFVPCPADGNNFDDSNYANSVQMTFEQVDLLSRIFDMYPKQFAPVGSDKDSAAYSLKAFKSKHPRLVSPMGIEGLHQIGNHPSNLRHMHALGVRYATLTHNCHNKYADAALTEIPGSHGIEVAKPKWNGVSFDGQELIREMNRLGMIVDLSHTSYATQLHVLGGDKAIGGDKDGWAGSRAPLMFSHSSAYALCPHPRNVKDDVLELVKARRGVVMVNFSPDFISCRASNSTSGLPEFVPQNATLAHVVDHIKYIGSKIGYEYVGLGSDFDGIETVPTGLEDVSKFPDLVKALLMRGVHDKDVSKIVGGNVLRVWKAVEKVSAEMRNQGALPLEDNLPNFIE